jgi:transposase-like protein
VLSELRNRGVADVLIAYCDGLKGPPEAIETVWPATVAQTCVVHYAALLVIADVVADSLAGQWFRAAEDGMIR